MAASPDFLIQKLDKRHELTGFDCGNDALNVWLKRFALMNVANDTSRVYVAQRSDGVVAGYHALVAGSVSREESPERISRGLAAHPVGVVVLARLAVTISAQGQGLGVSLLQDALLRTQQAADTIGIRAVLVHAIDIKALKFYLKIWFQPLPG